MNINARLREWSRPPRRWVNAVRSHRATHAAVRASHGAAERVGLAARARPGRTGRAESWARLARDIARLPAPTAPTRSVSIVLIPDHKTPVDPAATNAFGAELIVARPVGTETLAAAAARAARSARHDLLCFMLASANTYDAGWLGRLASVVDGTTVVAAAPVVVHPIRTTTRATPHDGHVRARGLALEVSGDAPALRAIGAGAVVALGQGQVRVTGTTAACLVVDRRAYEAAGPIRDSEDLDLALFDLGRRLDARGGQVVVVSDAVVVDNRPVRSRRALVEPVATDTSAWRSYVEALGPELMRAAAPLPASTLRIAITVASPSEKIAPRWGDWHLAEALARSLRRLGHVVRVQTLDHADDLAGRSSDVHCVVRGLSPVRRTPGQAHVLWVISHPDGITDDECDAADLVLVASTRFADALQRRTRTPVEVMLQATDTYRFRPMPPDPAHAHDVVVVAKSRDVFRSAVADAIAAGVRPAIYGSGWDNFVDPELVVADYVPNEELPIVYASAGVLLNDHWQSMHTWGFVSNRLFDALACETPVISEDLPELDELFEGAVLSYRDPAGLRELVEAALGDRPAARARAARGRVLISERHTFDHRAAQLLDALRRHALTGSRDAPKS